MVRARRRYHHHNYNHHHQNNQNISSAGSGGGGGGGGGAGGGGNGGPRVGGNRHALNHNHHQFHRSNKRPAHVPSAPSNTTQFIMNDHELIEPDFDLMHNAIMEHYNQRKRRKLQNEQNELLQQSDEGSEKSADLEAKNTGSPNAERQKDIIEHQSIENDRPIKQHKSSPTAAASPLRTATTTTTTSTITTRSPSKSPLKDVDDEESKNHHDHHNLNHQTQKMQQQQQKQQNQMQHNIKQTTTTMQLQESTNVSQPTTPNYYYRPTGSPGDEDGLSPFINHEHLQSEFQEVYANIHTERLSSMSKHQLVDKYLLLEERVEELENQLRESQTASAAASHG